MNKGLTGTEIAEQLQLPPALRREWGTGEYYGCLSQNVKGVYQRYMTWFDGNPANIWKHPPVAEAHRYISCIGGISTVISKAQSFAEKGDLRFAATLLDHVVAAEPNNENGKRELAAVYKQLGFGAENAVWRNFYLTAAKELGNERKGVEQSVIAVDPQSSVEDWLDALSLQIDGPRACEVAGLRIVVDILDEGRSWVLTLRNGTLTYRGGELGSFQWVEEVDLRVAVRRSEVYDIIAKGDVEAAKKNGEGKIEALITLLELGNIL